MARIIEWSEGQEKEWAKWVESRPEIIQDLCRRFPPYNLYRLKDLGQRVTIYSYSENGTMTVNVSGDYNFVTFERQVFGIKPDDLEECDLPDASESVGVLFTEDKEVEEFIDRIRPAILANRN